MPSRPEPFLNEYYYHIFNRFIDSREIFKDSSYSTLLLNLLSYYRSTRSTLSYSKFIRLPKALQSEMIPDPDDRRHHKVEIIAYCLMPTHFHLLIKQKIEKTIPKYLSDVLNAFTRSYNLKHKRKGPLFLPRFKSVSITTDEQFLHVSRYIHLNPYSSGLINRKNNISDYPFSSLKEYMEKETLCDTKYLKDLFNKDKSSYLQFVLDNADYQKSLEELKYLDKW